jgi:hypothetical protein
MLHDGMSSSMLYLKVLSK